MEHQRSAPDAGNFAICGSDGNKSIANCVANAASENCTCFVGESFYFIEILPNLGLEDQAMYLPNSSSRAIES